MSARAHVLVLGGGPDAEREVSIASSNAVADALRTHGAYDVTHELIDAIDTSDLVRMPGDVIFPVLHGPWGEGGGLQDVLESSERPYVGSGPIGARAAMDKIHTKGVAAILGMETSVHAIAMPGDTRCVMEFPVVVKPVLEGSTIGLHKCRNADDYARAVDDVAQTARVSMVEPLIEGRELTLGLIADAYPEPNDWLALPMIEITPASGHYDYEAKYLRDDTVYTVAPELPAGLAQRLGEQTARLARMLELRHLCRADFILDDDGSAWLLEINTMPGFTDHSLLPMAAAHAGIAMPELCARLVEAALADHPTHAGAL